MADPKTPAPSSTFFSKVANRQSGVCLYGIAPPKQSTAQHRLAEIATQQVARLAALNLDGLVVYDIQDEADRVSTPRPFPFLPTVDPSHYADSWLTDLGVPKIVYRSVGQTSAEDFKGWLSQQHRPDAAANDKRAVVLVGSPSQSATRALSLEEAYALRAQAFPSLPVGGIAIAERHARKGNEHERLLHKMDHGCQFFVTQAVYDVTATKSLISDYALALDMADRPPAPFC